MLRYLMGVFDALVALIVKVFHMSLLVGVIVTPFLYLFPRFCKLWPLLLLHATMCMSLLVHWKLNDDTCFLTVVESSVRGVEKKQSFMHSMMSPVYKIQDEDLKRISLAVVPFLMAFSIIQLVLSKGEVINDLKLILSGRPIPISP
jgi:hypothetical protein